MFVYVECSSSSSISPDGSDPTVEEFAISTPTALFTLRSPVDFEVTDHYNIALEVVDLSKTPENTGTLGIKVNNPHLSLYILPLHQVIYDLVQYILVLTFILNRGFQTKYK